MLKTRTFLNKTFVTVLARKALVIGVNAFVIRSGVLAFKRLVTVIALERAFLRMGVAVLDEAGRRAERLGAELALVRVLAGVYAHVNPQVVLVLVTLLAEGTLERALAGMQEHVVVEACLRGVLFVALVARELFLIVPLFVCLEGSLTPERPVANVTGVGFGLPLEGDISLVVRVRRHVQQHRLHRREAHLAHLAREVLRFAAKLHVHPVGSLHVVSRVVQPMLQKFVHLKPHKSHSKTPTHYIFGVLHQFLSR